MPLDYEQDRVLVQRAARSDRDAMRQIVERHQDRVYRLAYRLVGDAEVAQDISQEVFLRAFENLGCVKQGRALSQWLRQITVHLVRDRWRTRKEEVHFDEESPHLPLSKQDPAREAEAREIGERVQAALISLPHACREVFLLRYVEEMPYEEISETLGISVPAARVTAHRARKMLRGLLREYDEGAEGAYPS
jgi:RNA polymerase sigma-70 factor (ECF subfamily)